MRSRVLPITFGIHMFYLLSCSRQQQSKAAAAGTVPVLFFYIDGLLLS